MVQPTREELNEIEGVVSKANTSMLPVKLEGIEFDLAKRVYNIKKELKVAQKKLWEHLSNVYPEVADDSKQHRVDTADVPLGIAILRENIEDDSPSMEGFAKFLRDMGYVNDV